MNHLIELSREELIAIEGGSMISEWGAKCHETWCEIISDLKAVANACQFATLADIA